MSTNWLKTLPAGITEDDLIDLVDGVALLPKREAAVLSALKAEPRLGLLVKQMREDRGMVVGMGEAVAPVGLADAIEARLEAEAIQSLAAAESDAMHASSDAIPISNYRVEQVGMWHTLLEGAWPRRLATAASIAIVGGLAFFGGREVIRGMKIGGGSTTIVKGPDGGSGVTPVPPIMPEGGLAPVAVATNKTTATGAHEPHELDFSPDAVATVTNPDTTTVAAASPDTPAAESPMTLAQAVALAREGRLVISVRATKDAAGAMKRVETLARAGGREDGWHALPMNSIPAEYAMLGTPSMLAPAGASPKAGGVGEPDTTVASDRPGQPDHAATGPAVTTDGAAALPALRPVVKAIYTIDLDARERVLSNLIRTLGDDRGGCEVVLRRLEQPIVRPLSLEPEDILWWNSQSGAWARKAVVPVVIEAVE